MIIENLINKTLALDPNTATFMKSLSNKIIEVEVTTLKKNYYFGIINNKVQFQQTPMDPICASIKGPLKAFLKLFLTKDPHAAARLGLTLEGDANTLQQLQQFLKGIDIDWEEPLSHWTGDIVAHKMTRFSGMAKNKQKSFLKSSSQMITEYLQEESQILPTRAEVTFFCNEVDELRAAVDRVSARVDYLMERL